MISHSDVVIVGGGPSGMMLAYQLAANGIGVQVVERHPDFRREFRGELMMPSVLGPLNELGILEALRARGDARTPVERRLFVGTQRRVTAPGGPQIGAWISQPSLLQLLHEESSKYSNYRMHWSTTATALITDEGRVTGVAVRRAGEHQSLMSDLVIVSSGRGKGLRDSAGLTATPLLRGSSVLWLRFDLSETPRLLPDTVDVHMHGRGRVVVVFRADGHHLHVAFSAPGDLGALRTDAAALRATLEPLLPAQIATVVGKQLAMSPTSQLLHVVIDRLDRWHVPGAIFLGDASHTMSPMAGQGLNIAIRDSIVAANHLIDAKRSARPWDDSVLAAIQTEREPEVAAMQALQQRVHRIVMAPKIVEHIMFSILGIVLRFGRTSDVTRGSVPVTMKYGKPISGSAAVDGE